jgi:hypothetical protein
VIDVAFRWAGLGLILLVVRQAIEYSKSPIVADVEQHSFGVKPELAKGIMIGSVSPLEVGLSVVVHNINRWSCPIAFRESPRDLLWNGTRCTAAASTHQRRSLAHHT